MLEMSKSASAGPVTAHANVVAVVVAQGEYTRPYGSVKCQRFCNVKLQARVDAIVLCRSS